MSGGRAGLVQGWVVGVAGFARAETLAIVLAYALDLAWMIWLVAVATGSVRESGVHRRSDHGARRPGPSVGLPL